MYWSIGKVLLLIAYLYVVIAIYINNIRGYMSAIDTTALDRVDAIPSSGMNANADDTSKDINDRQINSTSDPQGSASDLEEDSSINGIIDSTFNPQKGLTSTVKKIGSTIVKTIMQKKFPIRFDLVGREVCVLKLLQQFPWCPRLLGSTKYTVTTSFVGETVNKTNIPPDYADQYRQILADMASVGVKHNDIIPTNPNKTKIEVMVMNGRLSLIDFSWGTVNDQLPCGVGPSQELFGYGFNPSNDTMALDCLDAIASNGVKNITINIYGTIWK